MKNKFLLLGLFPIFATAQEFKIFETTQDILPTKTVEVKSNTIDIFNVNSGIKDIFPQKTIEKTATDIRVYNYNNGIRDVLPTTIIIKEVPVIKETPMPTFEIKFD